MVGDCCGRGIIEIKCPYTVIEIPILLNVFMTVLSMSSISIAAVSTLSLGKSRAHLAKIPVQSSRVPTEPKFIFNSWDKDISLYRISP